MLDKFDKFQKAMHQKGIGVWIPDWTEEQRSKVINLIIEYFTSDEIEGFLAMERKTYMELPTVNHRALDIWCEAKKRKSRQTEAN